MAEQKACARGWVHAFLGCGQRKTGRNPSGLAGSSSSPDGAPFSAGFARVKASPSGEVVERQRRPEGFLPVSHYISPSGSRYAPPFTHSK